MSYTAEYTRPYVGGWQNTPSKETPVMAENLNNYDTAIISIESYLSEAINNDFAQLSEAGYSLGLEIDHSTYVMTISLKNKAGTIISSKSIDFPLESMIIHAEYNESTKFITMTLQNGQTLDVNISAIVSGLVPDTRTIAGFELKNDITSEELKNALAVPSKVSELDNDLGYITSEDVKSDDSVVAIGEIKNWLYDTSGEEIVVGVYGGKPLYRKSFYYENYALSEEYNYFNFDVDVEKIVDVKAFMENSSHTNIRPINTYPFEEGSSPANALYYIIELDQKRIRICTNTAWSSPNIYFTLEYTKTTDAEGSGNRLTPYGFVRKDFANTSEYDMQKSYYGGLSIEKICGAVEQNGVPTIDSLVEIQNVDLTEIKTENNDKTKSSTAKVAFTGRAVEVSESDAYTYEKDGKYYVADTIEKTDGEYKKVQRVLHLVFDGTEEWSRAVNADGSTYRMIFYDSDIPSYTDLGVRTWSKVLMCSHMQQCLSSSTQPYSGGETIAIHNSNHMIQLYSAKHQDLDSWKAFLAEQYTNGTPFTVDVRLAEPIITELSDADKIQLLSLKTFEEVTHLSTDSVIKPIITSEYGISKTGGYTLESLQTAQRNDLRINALENLAIE